MKRYGWVIEIRQEKIAEYKKLHTAVWPEILDMIQQCHFENYSIYLRELTPGRFYLFSYLEYTGNNFESDAAKMAADPNTQKWWAVCKPCQKPIETASAKDWWADMEEVFHLD